MTSTKPDKNCKKKDISKPNPRLVYDEHGNVLFVINDDLSFIKGMYLIEANGGVVHAEDPSIWQSYYVIKGIHVPDMLWCNEEAQELVKKDIAKKGFTFKRFIKID